MMDHGACYSPLKEQPLHDVSVAEHKTVQHSTPFLPHSHFTFDMLFLRIVYQRMEDLGYYSKENKGVHVAFFRKCMRRLLDMFDSELTYDFEAFGGKRRAIYIRWDDIRHATADGRLPEVELTYAERIMMVLDGNMNSYAGAAWAMIVFTAIILNVIGIVVQTMEHDICYATLNDKHCHGSMVVLTMIFSIDYFGKLVCSPFCRHGLFNTEWLIEHVIIDPHEPNAPAPTQAKPLTRLWYFVSVPMHIVDFLSILPFWLNMLVGSLHLQLGFLRSLRLLRLFRVLKFGKFSKTLLVLGDTFRKSAQSIGVLILYIVMVSLMAGAVIYKFETDARDDPEEAFTTVPKALWWVTTRMVSMHHSLPGAEGIPVTMVSGLIVASVGMFRGVIFVLPIGQITTAFKDAWAAQQTTDRLHREIDREEETPLGFEWTQDPTSPVLRVELYHVLQDGSDRDIDAYGSLPLPLYSAEMVDILLWVKIYGRDMSNSLLGNSWPELHFHVIWEPCSDTRAGEKLPRGTLAVQCLEGRNFPGPASQLWGAKLLMPVRLHGEGAIDEQKTVCSLTGSPRPTWDRDHEFEYEVEWSDGKGRAAPAKQEAQAPSLQESFQKRVLGLLEEQTMRVAALENELAKLRDTK